MTDANTIGTLADDGLVFKFSSEKKVTYIYDKKELVPENSPSLKTACIPFDFTNPPIEPVRLAVTLFETQFAKRGIGLTCNQIGIPYAVFTAGWDNDNKQVFFNPQIIEQSEDTHLEVEGCLTYPGLFLKVKRPNWIRIKFQHVNGEWREEQFYGMTSRVLMHEMDHINGKLFTDQVSKMSLTAAREKRKKYMRRIKRQVIEQVKVTV